MVRKDKAESISDKPKLSLGEMADAYYKKKQELNEANTVVKKLTAELTLMQTEYMQAMQEQGLDQVKGKIGRLTVQDKKAYNVSDFNKFSAWAVKNNMLHAFTRSVSAEAIREYYEHHPKAKSIPGLELREWQTLSYGKAQ